MSVNKEFAHHFAAEWIESWNSHDLERVLSHYTEDFDMSSPFIKHIAGDHSGTLHGKHAVAEYWRAALVKFPELKFELMDVLWSVDTICLYYKSILGLRAVEWLRFNELGKVVQASGHYSDSA